jgi:hypothetical protein
MSNKKPGPTIAMFAVVAVIVLVSGQLFAHQSADTTFRLLSFEVANSGPRLSTTRGYRRFRLCRVIADIKKQRSGRVHKEWHR